MDNIKVVKKTGLKRINLRVSSSGDVSVTAPSRTPDYLINKFISDNDSWIKKRVKESSKLKFIKDGQRIGILTIRISDDVVGKYSYSSHNKVIILNSSYQSEHRNIVSDFVLLKAKQYLPEQVRVVADEASQEVSKIAIKSAKTRWGSCSSKKNINISKYLWLLPEDAKKYVITHEVSHLSHMDHSKDFWKRVEELLPDYKKCQSTLKKHSAILGCLED